MARVCRKFKKVGGSRRCVSFGKSNKSTRGSSSQTPVWAWLLAGIAIGIIILLIVCYLLGEPSATPSDNPVTIVVKGAGTIIAYILPPKIPEQITASPSPATPTPTPEVPTPPPQWEEQVGVTGGTGTGSITGFDNFNEYFGMGSMSPFSPAGNGDIKIEFSYRWSMSPEDPCSPESCGDGVVWCLHDSLNVQIFHAIVPTPDVTYTKSVSGTWDGVNDWRVFVGNNCPCDIETEWELKVFKFG